MQREITQDEIGEATKTYLEWTKAEDYTPKSLIIIGMASKGEQLAVMQVVIGRRNWIARAFASLIKNSSDMREVLTEVIGASLFNKILENKMTKVSNKKVTVSNEGKLRDSYVN